jgi:predicted transglutaminase-like cysteine proteinase
LLTTPRLFRRISKLAFLLLAVIALIPGNALDMNRLQLSFRALGGNQSVFNEWSVLMQTPISTPIEERLQKANDFFNRKLAYFDDQEIWNMPDYWATPMESLSRSKADCEDYVIAKYFALRQMNVPDNQLRLIYVKARIGGANSKVQQAHMVLAYYPSANGEPLVLDNLVSDIRPASRRTDLLPIFSFNTQGVFTGAAATATLGTGGTSRLSRWQDLLERARQEGFD